MFPHQFLNQIFEPNLNVLSDCLHKNSCAAGFEFWTIRMKEGLGHDRSERGWGRWGAGFAVVFPGWGRRSGGDGFLKMLTRKGCAHLNEDRNGFPWNRLYAECHIPALRLKKHMDRNKTTFLTLRTWTIFFPDNRLLSQSQMHWNTGT